MMNSALAKANKANRWPIVPLGDFVTQRIELFSGDLFEGGNSVKNGCLNITIDRGYLL
jgi:hypothetical protein